MSKFEVGPARPFKHPSEREEDGHEEDALEADEFYGLERLDRDELDELDPEGDD
jgi:hypothetical protein